MTDRYAPLRGIAAALGVDAVALVPGPNFTRVMGRAFHSHERPFVVVVPAEGAPAAIVPNLELGSWAQVGFEGEVFDWRDQDGYRPAFEALARRMHLSSLGVEGQVMRVFVHHALVSSQPGLRVVDAEREISGLRLRKTPEEIAGLEAAIRISETALSELLAGVAVGQTEAEIERRLTGLLFHHGAEDMAFGPIVAAGDNSAQPHAKAREDYRIKPGDPLLLDFGARARGMAADITRTVFVGEPSAEASEVYETVRRANQIGHEITRPGVTAHEIDDAVTGHLEASPYADRIRTKTGHGLGRDVHEGPYVMRGNHQALGAGMVFTDEPGLYKLGAFGVRIEDDILVTDDGCRSLTTFTSDLTVIG
ncbi:M24 family metallopeptidase [Histidinibacterium aquaticum]|uniref:Aminopeptidase P family protein n=1 Tax=Histidinibacterium aquaticum TaxID=2613962 RepID=A0A5J5GJ22_9RHOB|nr:Xaa-Pro peptidase family protein [Histidinibacterium aquaticum]KAA9008226.1 aminopeptidase P family protein [Histidinibacterium aquaticum]